MAQERQVEGTEPEENEPTEEELANLSPEEREALKAGEEGEEGKEGEGEGEDEGEEETGEEDGGVEEAASDDRGAFIPTYQLQAEQLKQKQAEASEKIADLKKQYEAGDLTVAEFIAKRDEIRDEVQSLKIKSELKAELTEENIRNAWEQEQEQFFLDNPDWTLEKNPALYGALNEQVKVRAADPANARRNGSWILNESKKDIEKLLRLPSEDGGGKEEAEGAAAAKEKKEGEDKGTGKEKMPKPKTPKTLAHVPAAKEGETGQGEFDGLDGLEGLDLEKAIAQMSPAQQERYAALG